MSTQRGASAAVVPPSQQSFRMTGVPMLDRYAQSYQQIADAIVAALPPDWSKVWIRAEMADDNGMVAGFYVTSESDKPQYPKIPATVYPAFRAMHDAARESGDAANIWTSATFILERSGKADIDYGYDPIPMEDQRSRVNAWVRRYAPA